jgi:hypothetical protein
MIVFVVIPFRGSAAVLTLPASALCARFGKQYGRHGHNRVRHTMLLQTCMPVLMLQVLLKRDTNLAYC